MVRGVRRSSRVCRAAHRAAEQILRSSAASGDGEPGGTCERDFRQPDHPLAYGFRCRTMYSARTSRFTMCRGTGCGWLLHTCLEARDRSHIVMEWGDRSGAHSW